MTSNVLKKQVARYTQITLGALIVCLGFNLFIIPAHLLTGGLSGVALIIYYLTGLPVGMQNIVYNLPILYLAYRVFGRLYAWDTIVGTVVLSLILDATHFMVSWNITQDGIGADWHPSPITHEKNSYLAADHICKALGIPYSGVGLDFAADGEYGCDFDKSNGADGWPYFSDWNKSLNINISSGGKSSEEILGYVRNLDLTKGSYTLAFSVKGGEKAEIPYAVRSMKDPKIVYCEGVCKEGTASEAFTMKADAADCEIVFPVGAVGGLNLTFENITLYKNAG